MPVSAFELGQIAFANLRLIGHRRQRKAAILPPDFDRVLTEQETIDDLDGDGFPTAGAIVCRDGYCVFDHLRQIINCDQDVLRRRCSAHDADFGNAVGNQLRKLPGRSSGAYPRF